MPVPPLVLVVEDDPDVLEAVCDVLEVGGFRVARAWNGAEAMERVAEERPAVILLDLRAPVTDGEELARRLRKGGQGDIPIVILSADGNPRQAALLGAQGYLAKPFDLQALLTQVRSMTSRG